MRRTGIAIAAGALTLLGIAAPASATITPTDTASSLATALDNNAGIAGATLPTLPPHMGGDPIPNAFSDTTLTGFPTHGASYSIMTSGDPLLADTLNNDDGSGYAYDGTSTVRGDSDYDVSVLSLPFTAPGGSTCLAFDFKFLSEEYPEFVGSEFNDAFLAELDATTWTTTDSNIVAPNNFVVDEQNNPVTINSTGTVTVSAANSFGTTYDAATRKLRISTPITPGAHTLYLSILDQGDGILDAAAFVDNLTVSSLACTPGSVPIDNPGTTPPEAGGTPDPGAETITVDLPNDGGTYLCQVEDADDPEDAPPFETCTDGEVLGPFDPGIHWVLHIVKLGPDGTPDQTPDDTPFCFGDCTPPPGPTPGVTPPAIVPATTLPTPPASAKKKCKKGFKLKKGKCKKKKKK